MENFKHIVLTDSDRGLMACCKTIMHRDHRELFRKLTIGIDAFNFTQYMGGMTENERELMQEGGALMYHIMTNPDFLKECKNIYSKEKTEAPKKTKKK